MTLIIDLTPEEEARLQAAARRQGIDPAECARRLLQQNLPESPPGAATRALFAQWAREDATEDPAEIRAREVEWNETRRSLNEARLVAGEEPLFDD